MLTSRTLLIACLAFPLVVACEGETGPAGLQGEPGQPGETGEDGVDGEDGEDGEDGTGTPSVSGIVPGEVFIERTIEVLVSGNGTSWTAAAEVDFGDGITVDDLVVASPTAIRATITIDAGATLGDRDVVVTEGTESATYAGAFQVSEPITTASLGTQAQGSILLSLVELEDLSTPFDPNFVLFGLDGLTLGAPDNASPFALDGLVFIDVLTPAGAADIVVDGNGLGTDLSRDVDAVDVAARTPTAVTVGTDVTGDLVEAFATQVFEIAVPANNLVSLDIATTTMDADPFMIVLDDTGSFDNLLDADVAVTLPTSMTAETYYVVVWDNTGTAAVDFTIESEGLTITSESEPNDTSATADALTVPAAVSAAITPNTDQDFFSVTAAAGTTITAATSGSGMDVCGPTGDIDTFVEIRDVNGTTVLASNEDINGGNNWCSNVSFDVVTAGTYFIRVNNSPFSPMATYDYTLSVTVE